MSFLAGLTDTQLRASPPSVRDDYLSGQTLADQTGAAGVLTFTFSPAVQLVVVEASVASRADPFGGTPSATAGIPCDAATPNYMPVTTSSVKVYAPTGATVSVWGYGR